MTGTSDLPFSNVKVVGTGLLGTSVGLGLSQLGLNVWLSDQSSTTLALAVDYGAGSADAPVTDDIQLVVVATPPDVTAVVVAEALKTFPSAVVIDVASVKGSILAGLQASGADLARYLGTHPMAGREKGGPTAARVDLFTGRPWVICEREDLDEQTIQAVSTLVSALGASVHRMSTVEHDRAVGLVSHFPQLVSSVVAGQLNSAVSEDLELAGQGLRDVTRIAASDPGLWQQIISHNSPQIAGLLRSTSAELARLADALDDLGAQGAKRELAEVLEAGVSGVSKIPGKHGRSSTFASLTVIIDDRPGQLAALLSDVGDIGVNLEDMRLEHSPGATVGFVELDVDPASAHSLEEALEARNWRIAGERA